MSLANLPNGKLGLIVMKSAKELGERIDRALCAKKHELTMLNQFDYVREDDTFIIPIEELRFSNGEAKVIIGETVRGKDIYIVSDIGNYNVKYKMYGMDCHMGPDEHFQDIKRVVSALGGKAKRVTVIMPLLYASRQSKRKGRESLDCALALQELERLGVQNIITFDVHDANVQNAIPLVTFQNIYPTYEIVKQILHDDEDRIIKDKDTIVISPDTGGMDRSIYYANMLDLDVGFFYKRRDFSTLVDGKYPIVEHQYLGKNVEGMNVLITDDMISSGQSIIDISVKLKEMGVKSIIVAVSFALFTEGLDRIKELIEKGVIDRIYSTNLTYIPNELKEYEWFKTVDMSYYAASIIDCINRDESIEPILDNRNAIETLFRL